MTTSKELKDAICEEYLNNPNIRIDEMYTKYNISEGTFIKIRKERNLPMRSRQIRAPVNRKNLIKFDENYFEIIDCEKKAYWLGFILGDGHISKNNSFMTIGLASKDIEHLKLFKLDLNSNHVIKEKTIFDIRTSKSYSSCHIHICRQKTCNDLINHGITNTKSTDCNLPDIPKELIHHFLRGLSDADGCFTIDGKNLVFALACPVEKLLQEIQLILMETCDLAETKITYQKSCYTLKYGGNKQTKRIFEYLYKDSTRCLDRKFNLANNHLNEIECSDNILYENLHEAKIALI